MLGAALGVVTLLATRLYGFVWETTILPADTFDPQRIVDFAIDRRRAPLAIDQGA